MLRRNFKFAVLATALLASPASADWRVDADRDPMTDVTRVRLVSSAAGNSIVLRCDSRPKSKLYVRFVSDTFLGGGGLRPQLRSIAFRFDEDPAFETLFYYSDTTADSFKKSDVERFVARATTANRLRVRAVTYRYETVDAEFNITGLEPLLPDLLTACPIR